MLITISCHHLDTSVPASQKKTLVLVAKFFLQTIAKDVILNLVRDVCLLDAIH